MDTQSDVTLSEALLISQLEQHYSGAHEIYTLMMQGTGLAIGVEILIMGFGFQNHSAGALFSGGILFLALYNLYYRAGQTLGGLMANVLALEAEMHIEPHRSIAVALLTSFRGRDMLEQLKKYQPLKGDEALKWLGNSTDFALFGSLRHLGRSRTALTILVIALLQIGGAILLLARGWTI